MPEPGDVVVALNNEAIPFTIKWNKREYKLMPGTPSFVPFEAACNWFGDPRSTANIASYTGIDGLVAFVPDRASEVRRLRRKYGAVYGDELGFYNSTKDERGQPGEPIYIPNVTVSDPDGQKLWMVVEDPTGEHSELATPTISDQAGMLATLKRQQAQIDLLMVQLSGETPAESVGMISESGEVVPPTDDAEVGAANKPVKAAR